MRIIDDAYRVYAFQLIKIRKFLLDALRQVNKLRLEKTREKKQYNNKKKCMMFLTLKMLKSTRSSLEPFMQTKGLCGSHQVASHLLFQELFTGFVEGAGFVGHKQILLLKGVQVLQGCAHIFEDGITLFLVTVQLISGFPEGRRRGAVDI